MGLIVKLLQGLAGVLDKYVPGQGARHLIPGLLAILFAITGFLTGQMTPEAAGSVILLAVQGIFAALHKPPPPSA